MQGHRCGLLHGKADLLSEAAKSSSAVESGSVMQQSLKKQYTLELKIGLLEYF